MTSKFGNDANDLQNSQKNAESGEIGLNTEGVPTHRLDEHRPSVADSNVPSNFTGS